MNTHAGRISKLFFPHEISVIDTVRVFSFRLKPLLTVVRGHFGRKNEYRYLKYTTITGNSFDRKNLINKFDIYMKTISIKSTFVKFL